MTENPQGFGSFDPDDRPRFGATFGEPASAEPAVPSPPSGLGGVDVDADEPAPMPPAPAPAKASSGRASTGRSAGGRTSTGRGRGSGGGRAATKTAARRTSGRSGTGRGTTRSGARSGGTGRGRATRGEVSGPLAASLSTLVDQLAAEISAVNDLSRVIDDHVSALNALRAEQQQRVALLLEVRAASGGGTLGTYVDEQLGELSAPAVDEESFPWPT